MNASTAQPERDPSPSRRAGLKSALRWALLPLTLALLAWVVWPVAREWDQVGPMLMRPALAAALLGGALAYAVALWLAMAPGWWWLLGLYGRRPRALPACAVWTRTQIGKYIPGNVGHYLGRQVVGRRLGLHHAEMAAASLLELVSILGAAGLIGVLGLALGAVNPPGDQGASAADASDRLIVAMPVLLGLVVGGLLAWPIADSIARRVPWAARHMEGLPRLSPWRSLRLLGPTLAVHAAFLSSTGLILWSIAGTIAPDRPLALPRTIWVYAVAWAIGTITPGGGGGMGWREAILTFELSDDLGRPEAAAVAIMLRLATITGDVLAFGASMLVRIDVQVVHAESPRSACSSEPRA